MKYATVHIYLKKNKGAPSQYGCNFCGKPAQEWVCINKNLTEIRQGTKVGYSTDLDDYVPGCMSCNRKLDRPPQELCSKGHNDWIENKNKTHKKRTCGTCRKEYQKNYSQKRKSIRGTGE